MGRPRNEEEVERLQDTAFELFAVKGLDATSYSDIAKNAYVTKSHVQHYPSANWSMSITSSSITRCTTRRCSA